MYMTTFIWRDCSSIRATKLQVCALLYLHFDVPRMMTIHLTVHKLGSKIGYKCQNNVVGLRDIARGQSLGHLWSLVGEDCL